MEIVLRRYFEVRLQISIVAIHQQQSVRTFEVRDTVVSLQ